MLLKKNIIVVTGGNGRFAKSLKKVKSKYKFIYPSKEKLNICNINSIKTYLKTMTLLIFRKHISRIPDHLGLRGVVNQL